jgi:hypothetical protein
MMQHIIHSLKQQQPGLGMSAYWSLFANVSNDRTPEIRLGFQEGAGYA